MLTFQPKVGSVIFCDYRGFVAPEMVKKRPVIVFSKHRDNSKLIAVVPISTTISTKPLEYQIEMDSAFSETHLLGIKSWVKCDMINVVSLDRLHLVRSKESGLRYVPNVGLDFLSKVKKAIKNVHGL